MEIYIMENNLIKKRSMMFIKYKINRSYKVLGQDKVIPMNKF